MSFASINNASFGLALQKGEVNKFSAINKFGYNGAVGTSMELISVASANITYPTSAGAVTVVSASTADDSAGTGARTVLIEGLDENYDVQSETITMDGTTNVVTTNTYIRLFRMSVETAGTGGKNAGNITATIDGNEQVRISTDYENQSLICAYTIPNNYKGYITRVQFSAGKANKPSMGALFVRAENGVFQVKNLVELFRNNAIIELPNPIVLEGKTDIELRGQNLDASDTVSMSGTFDLVLQNLGE